MTRENNQYGHGAGYGAPILIGALFVFFIAITIINFFYQSRIDSARIMAEDVARLAAIFERIDSECGIISFDYQKNPINFLNIKKNGFVGSEIGSMNLAHPEKWNGPYLNDNPTMQAKEYQIVYTDAGYFITPGENVLLPNGKRIGTDIILDQKADIIAMMRDKQGLMADGKPLAIQILVKKATVSEALAIVLEDE